MIDEHATANWLSKPGDSIRAIMQRRNISAHDLAERFEDGLDAVLSLIDGSRQIDESTASTLSAMLGASAKFWLKDRRTLIRRSIVPSLKFDRAGHGGPANTPACPGQKARGKLSSERRAAEIRRRLVFYNVPDAESSRVAMAA
jgi:plasmid maintenance system antidote protein VapI